MSVAPRKQKAQSPRPLTFERQEVFDAMGLDTAINGWLTLATLALPVAYVGLALRDADRAASSLAASWRTEHEARVCGALVAARRNLGGAALALQSAEATAAGQHQIDALAAAYDFEGAFDADAPCAGVGGRLAATLHREHNPRIPRHWPNWIFRLEAAHDP